MDWKIAVTSFVTVFVAEIGDKTQLGTLLLASGTQSKLAVFLGASVALVATSAIAVIAGDLVTRTIPSIWIQRVAGGLLILLGGIILWSPKGYQ